MLINCPNCGFSQPQDKYCAQCGVDMESFKKEDSGSSFLKNPLFLLSIFVIATALGGVVFYKQDKENLQTRLNYLQGKNPTAISKANLAPPEDLPPGLVEDSGNVETASNTIPPSSPAVKIEASANTINATSAQPFAPTPTIAPTELPNKDAKSASALSANNSGNGPYVAHIYYAEVNYRALMQIYEESKTTGQFNSFGDYTAGIFSGFDKKVNLTNSQIKILQKIDKNLDVNKPLQWFIGINQRDSDQEVGFLHYLELSDTDGSAFKGNLEIIRSWKESPEASHLPSIKNQYPAMFELSKDSGFFITGLMPRTANLESDEALLSLDLFKILKSSQFKSKTSEFVIFIDFERN